MNDRAQGRGGDCRIPCRYPRAMALGGFSLPVKEWCDAEVLRAASFADGYRGLTLQ